MPFVEFSIRETSAAIPTADDGIWWRTTADHVLRQVPSLLREIAYRLDYLPHCSDLLWKLERDDKRPLNSNFDHPIRVLQDVASYKQHKPLRTHEIILERGVEWLGEADVSKHAHTPFEVLAGLLEKAGHSSFSRGYAIHYTPFLVNAAVTRRIRQAVFARFKAAISDADSRLASQALTALGNFLLPPHPPLGHRPSEEDEGQSVPEQQDVLASMIDAFMTATDSVRRLQIAAALPLYIRRRKEGRERDVVRPVLTAIATDPNLQRLRSLMETRGIDLEDDDEYDASDWKALADRRNAEMERTARQVMTTTAGDAYAQLVDDVRRMRAADMQTDTWNLFHAIARVDVDYGMQLAWMIWTDAESPLLGRSDVLIVQWPSMTAAIAIMRNRRDRLSLGFIRSSSALRWCLSECGSCI